MSVTKHRKISGDSGSLSRKGIWEYEERYLVKTSSWRDGPTVILSDPRTPKPYERHRENNLALVTTPRATRKSETSLWWDLVVPYSSEIDFEQRDPNPLARPPDYSWHSQPYSRIVTKDIFGNPIVNTAGDPPVPPLEEPATEWIVAVSRNLSVVPSWLLSYDGALNLDAFRADGMTFPRLTVRLLGLRISPQQIENRTRFRPVAFELHYREEGWSHLLPNRGYRWKKEDGSLEEIYSEGNPIPEPVFLDRQGRPFVVDDDYAVGYKLRPPERREVVIKEWHTVKRRSFRRLGTR